MWQQVCALLEDPQRLAQEYQRRLQEPHSKENRALLEAQAAKLKQGLSRLIDSYAEGLIDKQEFQPRIERSKDRLTKLEQTIQALADQETRQRELRLVITRLEEFAQRVTASLEQADWTRRRELIRTLVKRVEIGPEAVKVVFRVEPDTPSPSGTHLESGSLPHCGRRGQSAARQPVHEPFVEGLAEYQAGGAIPSSRGQLCG